MTFLFVSILAVSLFPQVPCHRSGALSGGGDLAADQVFSLPPLEDVQATAHYVCSLSADQGPFSRYVLGMVFCLYPQSTNPAPVWLRFQPGPLEPKPLLKLVDGSHEPLAPGEFRRDQGTLVIYDGHGWVLMAPEAQHMCDPSIS